MELIGRLGEAATSLREKHIGAFMAEYGLKTGEFDVIATLRRANSDHTLTPTELYNLTMISSGGMTARLDRLQKAGLIERVPHPSDRRALNVRLTDAGKTLLDALLPRYQALLDRMTAGLTDQEQELLSTLLLKLLNGTRDLKQNTKSM